MEGLSVTTCLLPECLRKEKHIPRALAISGVKRPVRALIIVDVQNDFFPDIGSLPAAKAPEIVPLINGFLRKYTASGLGLFSASQGKTVDQMRTDEKLKTIAHKVEIDYVILSLDWHPLDHWSFAAEHNDCAPFSKTVLSDGRSMHLWPTHCVQHSSGAAFHKDLERYPEGIHIRKGTKKQFDSFSAFGSPEEDTGLRKTLKALNVSDVFVVGLCTDYCVGETALDALKEGLSTTLLMDCCAGVAETSTQDMTRKIQEAGGKLCDSKAVFGSE